jgi:hypothetical protein
MNLARRQSLATALWFYFFLFPLTFGLLASAQEDKPRVPPTPGPMLADGTVELQTPDFDLVLVRSSQTVAALKPKSAPDFDFTPGDLLIERSQNGYFHLGDVTIRLREKNGSEWKNYSTAANRLPVTALATSSQVLASADLAPILPSDIPLQIVRTWALDEGHLGLRFTLKNKSDHPVEIGALGIPMIFNNVLNNRSLDEAHAKCSFYDPYIGEGAGYLQVTRLSGHGPALLVVPEAQTKFEAYNPILDRPNRWGAPPVFTDPTPRGITFEGFYEWLVHSAAYAEKEWKGVNEWNQPTSLTLQPGESKTYGVKFLLSPSIREIEHTLAKNDRPVAVGIPGYILPTDIDGRLFLKYPAKVKSLAVEPSGELSINKLPASTVHGWNAYAVKGNQWGRSRLTVTYDDGVVQTIHYFVMKPETKVVADMGHFLTTKDWFADPKDPFHRDPSVMTYDREANQIVMQDSRAWIAGLGDEGGGGGWIAAIMKQLVQPDKEEIDKLQQFIDGVVWGGLQYKDGGHKYGVRKSLFYYQPDEMPSGFYRSDFNWTTWTSWNKKASEQVDRSYDYPHVAALYWVMYHLDRQNPGKTTFDQCQRFDLIGEQPPEVDGPFFPIFRLRDFFRASDLLIPRQLLHGCTKVFCRKSGKADGMKSFGPALGAELEPNCRIIADFANCTPQREQFFGCKKHTRLTGERLRKSGAAKDCGRRYAKFFQFRKYAAGNAKVLIHRLYSDLRDAMSIEKRYFTSDLKSLS